MPSVAAFDLGLMLAHQCCCLSPSVQDTYILDAADEAGESVCIWCGAVFVMHQPMLENMLAAPCGSCRVEHRFSWQSGCLPKGMH